MLGWVVFRAPDLGTVVRVYAGMFGQSGIALRGEVAMLCKPSEWLALMIGTLLALAPAVAATLKPMTRSTMAATAQLGDRGLCCPALVALE